MLNETVNYTNWAPDEPNNAIPFDFGLWNDSDCVMIKSGKWNDTPCSLFYSYPALCSQRYNITLTTGKCSECQCITPKSNCTIACKIHRVTFKLLSWKLLFNKGKFMWCTRIKKTIKVYHVINRNRNLFFIHRLCPQVWRFKINSFKSSFVKTSSLNLKFQNKPRNRLYLIPAYIPQLYQQ